MKRVFLIVLTAIGLLVTDVAAGSSALMATLSSIERWSTLADPVFQHLTTDNGLPNLAVTAISDDSDGFVWFGTQAGLARWDGYRFRSYFFKAGDPDSLPDSNIRCIHTDSRGRLWIGTYGGLALYNRDQDRFIRVPISPYGGGSNVVASLADDGRDGLWVISLTGLDHLSPDGHVVAHFSPPDKHLPNGSLNVLLHDRSGKLWVGTQKGLFVADDNGGDFVAVPLSRAEDMQPQVTALAQSGDDKIWAGTVTHGAFVIDPKKRGAQALSETDAPSDFRHSTITCLNEVRQGEVWIGTYFEGIVVVKTATMQTRRLRHEATLPSGLAAQTVYGIAHDHSGMVWIGSNAGIDFADPGQIAVRSVFGDVAKPGGIRDKGVISVSQMENGKIWLALGNGSIDIVDAGATRVVPLNSLPRLGNAALPQMRLLALSGPLDGAVYIASPSGTYRVNLSNKRVGIIPFPSPEIRMSSALLLEGKKLWVSRPDGLWLVDPSDPTGRKEALLRGSALFANNISTLLHRADGVLWIGTSTNGIYRYDPASQSYSHFIANPDDRHALSNNCVFSMLLDSRGRLWIGTGGGVNLLVAPNDKGALYFQKIGTEQGLPHDTADMLLEDDNGNIWVSTDAGLAIIDPATLAVRSLRRADGVAIQTYYKNSGAKTTQGELLFGGLGGLTVVRPDLVKVWQYHPPIVVTDIKLGNKSVPSSRFNGMTQLKGEPLVIGSDVDSFSVGFAALDYSAPERNRYAYRMIGYDKDWIDSDATRRLATYTNLPPGEYSLQIRGTDRNGVWSDHQLAVPVRVLPTWYQTWWMRSMVVLAAIAALYALVERRTYFLRQRRAELEREVGLRTRELKENEIELMDKNRELARLNQMQVEQQSELTRFLAVASHDLRQPMHALSLYLGALSNLEMSESARPLVGNLQECARIMDNMFQALLDLSRLDAKVVEPRIEDFPIAALLSSLEVEFGPQARDKGLELRVASCSAWVRTDQGLVRQILGNLSANAVRYTESGTILIGCRRKGGHLRLAVFDTGVGIPDEQQKTVFEEFCQLNNEGRDRTKGMGLGLAIVRRLARLISTPITLTSCVGKGSMFAIDLPVIEPPRTALK